MRAAEEPHAMLDSRRVNALRLRFPDADQPDLVLGPGVHAIGFDAAGRPTIVQAVAWIAQIGIDARGIWLKVRSGARGLHVNARPVRRLAMLRPGDAIFVEGQPWLALGEEPSSPPAEPASPAQAASFPRAVLRGLGGPHHGRCITLEQPRLIGRLAMCDVRIDDAAFADRHARLEPHAEGVILRDLGSPDGSQVNGWPVRDALLRPGDQVVFDTHRFVIEAPSGKPVNEAKPGEDASPDDAGRLAETASRRSSSRRLPWLLFAALLLAASLSLLLLYGAR